MLGIRGDILVPFTEGFFLFILVVATYLKKTINTARLSIAGTRPGRLPCIGPVTVEHFVLGNVFLIMVQISMLETCMVSLHCLQRHTKDMLKLFKCYLNAGQ